MKAPDVKEEEWTTEKVIQLLGVDYRPPARSIQLVRDAHNASIRRVLEKKAAVTRNTHVRHNELLPCPFCGDSRVTAQEYDTKDAWWCVCDNIYCGAEGPRRKTRSDVVAAWNKRVAISVSDGSGSDASGASSLEFLRSNKFRNLSEDHDR